MSRITLVIGASSDIGISLIKDFDDDRLVIAHYNKSKDELCSLEDKYPSRIKPFAADLSSLKEVNHFVDNILQTYGVPDEIVFLAAGKFNHIRFKNLEWDDFSKEIDISVKSTFIILKKFLPLMAKRKKGKVVFMLSSCLFGVPPIALAHYTSVKSTLLGIVRSTAAEYANKNVQINAVSPSMVETKFLRQIDSKFVALVAQNHPMRRNALPEDVTPIIRFLLSEGSDYINGVNIPITGGSSF
ncbi:SDR family oxidoreductase [Gammaproteobacteria bacterium]|nr:SDR family oxidoreductase [Gammaproteobacteria bacterium]MDB4242853.1 SDR family oxidoreductase [Gammaproteobacteria bacterium]